MAVNEATRRTPPLLKYLSYENVISLKPFPRTFLTNDQEEYREATPTEGGNHKFEGSERVHKSGKSAVRQSRVSRNCRLLVILT